MNHRPLHPSVAVFAPDACLLTDPGGVILDANPAAAQLFRVPPAFLVRRPLASFVAEHDIGDFRGWVLKLFADESQRPSCWRAVIVRGNGERLAVDFSVRRTQHPDADSAQLCWLARRASPRTDIDR